MSFNTLDSAAHLTLGEGAFGDLTDLTIIADEFGEEPDSNFATNLIEYGRFLELAEDCQLIIGGPDDKPFNARLYLLNDLIIVGKYRKHGQAKRTLSTGTGSKGRIVFGAQQFDTLSGQSDTEESKAAAKAKNALKLRLWVDLSGVQVRDLHKESHHGVRIIYTTKEIEEGEDGEKIYVTNVDQTEMWFENEEVMTHFAGKIYDTIDSLIDHQLKEKNVSVSDGDSEHEDVVEVGSVETGEDGEGEGEGESTDGAVHQPSKVGTMRTQSVTSTRSQKKRSYGAAKATMKKIQKQRNQGKNTLDSIKDGTGPITLEDLESRYKVTLAPKAQADLAEFSVNFKQGSMGFALSSSEKASGVFVGKIEDNGMADIGGVTLGDRVIEIGGVKLDDSMNWHQCRDLIMQKRKELDSSGKPKPLVIKFARIRSVEENITKDNEEKKLQEKKDRAKRARAKRGGKRAWMTNKHKNKSFGHRLESIKDLEKKYLRPDENDKTQNACDEVFEKLFQVVEGKEEKRCVYILKEIYDTEKSYVHSLYTIKDQYIKKLGKKQVLLSCKEAGVASSNKFCEHNASASYCKKMSSQKKPLLSKADIKEIFVNVEVLMKINESLLQEIQLGLEKLNTHGEASKIGVNDVVSVYAPAFTKIMPFYMMYSQYAAKYPKALDRISELKESDDIFKDELQTLEAQKGIESLQSLLIKPISRLCKYPLLFDQLSEAIRPHLQRIALQATKTGKGDMDKLSKLVDDLESTRKLVSKVAETVDFKVGEENKMQALNDIFVELGGVNYIKEFFVPSRKFLRRFDDVVIEENKGSKPAYKKNCVVYVFNDITIFGSSKTAIKPGLSKGSDANASKRSTSAKQSVAGNQSVGGNESTVGSKEGNRKGFLKNLSKNNKGPPVTIEYQVEAKNIKVKGATAENSDRFGAQVFITVKAVEEPDKGRKNSKTETKAQHMTNKIVVWFTTEELREGFLKVLQQQLEGLQKSEESRKEAQVSMGTARLRLKERRNKNAPKGGAAASSASRQETLKKKLQEKRMTEQTIN